MEEIILVEIKDLEAIKVLEEVTKDLEQEIKDLEQEIKDLEQEIKVLEEIIRVLEVTRVGMDNKWDHQRWTNKK